MKIENARWSLLRIVFGIVIGVAIGIASLGCSQSSSPAPTGPPEPGVRGHASIDGVDTEVADGVAYWMKDMNELWVYMVSRKMSDEERKKVESASMVVERMVPGAKIVWLPIAFGKGAPHPTTFSTQDVERYAVSYSNFTKAPYTMNIYANQGPLADQGLQYLQGEFQPEGGKIVGRFVTSPALPKDAPDIKWNVEFSIPVIHVGT